MLNMSNVANMSNQDSNERMGTGTVRCVRCFRSVENYRLPSFDEACGGGQSKGKRSNKFCSFCGLPDTDTGNTLDTEGLKSSAKQGIGQQERNNASQREADDQRLTNFATLVDDQRFVTFMRIANLDRYYNFFVHCKRIAALNMSYGMPSGPPQQGYFPAQTYAASGLSSEHSEDSIMSQIPLPYHLSAGSSLGASCSGSSDGSSLALGYQQSSNVPFDAFQPTEGFGPEHHSLFGNGHNNMDNYGHGNNGYNQQAPVPQPFPPSQRHQQQGQFPQPQTGYHGGDVASQMFGYPQLGPQYPPQQQYSQFTQGPNMNQSHFVAASNLDPNAANQYQNVYGNNYNDVQVQRPGSSYPRQGNVDNQFHGRYNQPSNYQDGSQSQVNLNGRGQVQQQPYGMPGYGSGGTSQGYAASPGFESTAPHNFQAAFAIGDNVNDQAANASPMGMSNRAQFGSRIENSVYSSFSTESTGGPPSSTLTNATSDDQENAGKTDDDNNKTPMNCFSQLTSPQKSEAGTPLTLRSRKNQSVSLNSFKIDPVRGPPPAFWPGGLINKSALGSPSKQLGFQVTQAQTLNASTSKVDPKGDADPFTTGSMAHQIAGVQPSGFGSPQSMNNSIKAASHLPRLFTQLHAASSGPLVLAQKPTVSCGPSKHLASIAVNGKVPTVEVAFDRQNMPFVLSAREYSAPRDTGLVRISNIPYSVTRQEIVAFLGRNARILNEQNEPIHIIMERVTSKTNDAYVEFVNMQEAVTAVNRYETNRAIGRGGRLGERHVELEVVGHERLMHDLFPKAKNVRWDGAVPVVLPTDPNDKYNSGFNGFVSSEELVMLVKHVETPHRSPFSKECPQRPFECLISTLVKFPWYMVDNITLRDRNDIYKATDKLVNLLLQRIHTDPDHVSLNARLLKRLQRAIFTCPGFVESMKDNIACYCGMDARQAGLASYADHWYTFKTIGPKRGVEPDVLEYYQDLIREATQAQSLAQRYASSATFDGFPANIFGVVKIPFPADDQETYKLTLAEIANLEWSAIEELLRKRIAMGNIN